MSIFDDRCRWVKRLRDQDQKDMVVIGLDLGTKYGWCMIDLTKRGSKREPGKLIWAGARDLKKDADEAFAATTAGAIFRTFGHHLHSLVDQARSQRDRAVDVVFAYEDVLRFMSSGAAKRYGGLLGVLQLVCDERVDDEFMNLSSPIPTPLRSAKFHQTADGAASKEDMIAAAHEKVAKLCDNADMASLIQAEMNDDMADAIGIASLIEAKTRDP